MSETKKCDSPEEAVADLRVQLDKSTDPMERLHFQIQIELLGPMFALLKALPPQMKSDEFRDIAASVAGCWAGTVAGSLLSSVPEAYQGIACARMAAAMADGFMGHMEAIIAVRVPEGIADIGRA